VFTSGEIPSILAARDARLAENDDFIQIVKRVYQFADDAALIPHSAFSGILTED
jgi:hypothetical protein